MVSTHVLYNFSFTDVEIHHLKNDNITLLLSDKQQYANTVCNKYSKYATSSIACPGVLMHSTVICMDLGSNHTSDNLHQDY